LRYGLLGRRRLQTTKFAVDSAILACGHRVAYYLSNVAQDVASVLRVVVVHQLAVIAVSKRRWLRLLWSLPNRLLPQFVYILIACFLCVDVSVSDA
jgi:hypothetical protein